ncbi:MAG: hypothetical protein AABY61_17635 [Nitrospirota bacterium]
MLQTQEQRTGLTSDRFLDLHRLLTTKDDYFSAGPVKTPPHGTNRNKVRALGKLIEAASEELPLEYQNGFSKPLLNNLQQICEKMLLSFPQPHGWWGLIFCANAATQVSTTSPVHSSVQRLQAVIADIYTSFLYSDDRVKLGLGRKQRLPPLGAFTAPILPSHQVSPPPYMYSVELMKELSADFTAGVVSLPSGYINHPILWSILAHEIGGHDVLHADEGLLPELLEGITGLFSGPNADALASLWRFWGEEAAADVCGVLNIGPAYGLGAIVFHTVIAHIGGNPEDHDDPSREHIHPPILDIKPNPHLVGDPHPIPGLIPFIIIGAIEALTALTPSTKTRYILQIEELAKLCTPDYETINLSDYIIANDEGKWMKLGAKFSFNVLKDSALKVGRHIAKATFPSLNNKSLQNFETWDNADEEVAHNVAKALVAGDPIDKVKQKNGSTPEDAQLLAGAILAVFRQPARYDPVNEALGEAFDRSYTDDPLIHLVH